MTQITNLNKATLPESSNYLDDLLDSSEDLGEFIARVPFRFLRNSPIKKQYNESGKRYLRAFGSRELTETDIKFLTIYRDNVSKLDTFEIFYQDVFVSDIEKKQYKKFKFELLPAIESTVNHPGGSSVLRGATTIPDVKAGIPIRTVMKHRNINIMGGKNIIQTIGIDSKFVILVGAFIGDNEISSYQEAKFFDEQIVQPGLRVSTTIRAHFGANLALPNPKEEGKFKNLKGFISEFKLYAVRREKSYYSITLIIEDFPSLPDPIEDFRLEQQKLKEIELKKSPTPKQPPAGQSGQSGQSGQPVQLPPDLPEGERSNYSDMYQLFTVSTNNFKTVYNLPKLTPNASEDAIKDRLKELEAVLTKLRATDDKTRDNIKNFQGILAQGTGLGLPQSYGRTDIIVKEKDLDNILYSSDKFIKTKPYYEIYYRNKKELTEVYTDIGWLNYKIAELAWFSDFPKKNEYLNKSKTAFSKADQHGQSLKDQNLTESSIEGRRSELNTVQGVKSFINFSNYGLF